MEAAKEDSEVQLSTELWGDTLEETLSLDFGIAGGLIAFLDSILVLDVFKGDLGVVLDKQSGIFPFFLVVFMGDLPSEPEKLQINPFYDEKTA